MISVFVAILAAVSIAVPSCAVAPSRAVEYSDIFQLVRALPTRQRYELQQWAHDVFKYPRPEDTCTLRGMQTPVPCSWTGTAPPNVVTGIDRVKAQIASLPMPNRFAVLDWLEGSGRGDLHRLGVGDAQIGPCVWVIDSAPPFGIKSDDYCTAVRPSGSYDVPLRTDGASSASGIDIAGGFQILAKSGDQYLGCLTFRNASQKAATAVTFSVKFVDAYGEQLWYDATTASGQFPPDAVVKGPSDLTEYRVAEAGHNTSLLRNCWTAELLGRNFLYAVDHATVAVTGVTYDGSAWGAPRRSLADLFGAIQSLTVMQRSLLQLWAVATRSEWREFQPAAPRSIAADVEPIKAQIALMPARDRDHTLLWLGGHGRRYMYDWGITDAQIGPCLFPIDSGCTGPKGWREIPVRQDDATKASSIEIVDGFALVNNAGDDYVGCASFRNTNRKMATQVALWVQIVPAAWNGDYNDALWVAGAAATGRFPTNVVIRGPSNRAEYAAAKAREPASFKIYYRGDSKKPADAEGPRNCWASGGKIWPSTEPGAYHTLLWADHVVVGVIDVVYADGSHWETGGVPWEEPLPGP